MRKRIAALLRAWAQRLDPKAKVGRPRRRRQETPALFPQQPE